MCVTHQQGLDGKTALELAKTDEVIRLLKDPKAAESWEQDQ